MKSRIPMDAPMLSPRTPAVPDGVGQGLQSLGRGLFEAGDIERRYQERVQEARRGRDYHHGVRVAEKMLQDVSFAFEKDKEFDTAQERFDAEVSRVKDELLSGVADPMTRADLEGAFEGIALDTRHAFRTSLARRESAYSLSVFDNDTPAYLNHYAQAQTEDARDAAKKKYMAALDAHRDWMSAAEYEQRRGEFLRQGDYQRAAREIEQTGGAGFDPSRYAHLTPGQVETLRAKAEETHIVQRSQSEADRILAGGGTDAEVRAQAKTIEDPRVRDATLRRVEHELSYRQAQQLEVKRRAVEEAWRGLEQAQTLPEMAAIAESQPDRSTRKAMHEYIRTRATGKEPETDWSTYYELKSMPQDVLRDVDLFQYRPKLSDTHFKAFVDQQAKLKNGDADGSAARAGQLWKIAREEMNAVGIYVDKKDKSMSENVARFHDRFEEEVTRQGVTGDSQAREIARGLLDEAVLKRRFWFDKSVRRFELERPEGLPPEATWDDGRQAWVLVRGGELYEVEVVE